MVKSIQYLVFAALLVACIHAAERSIPDKASAVSTEIRQKRSNLWEPGYRFTSPKQDQLALDGSNVDPALQGMRLLDTVLLASVDGKLHGLNRTTGQPLWSMSNDPDADVPVTFNSLVRTEHSAHDPDREFFIIEPQSGDIYVLPPMASPSDTLQRLPLSTQQIVELSPFSFPGDEDRVFVGSKETSMIILELETGRVKGTINTDKECFWDDQPEAEEDESDISPPKRALRSPVVHIGRTDYHIRIHSRQHGVLQNLYYSSYGPNNIDREKQSKWKRTPDNLYVQSLPNGHVLAFQTEGPDMPEPIHYDGMPIWGREFKVPIVAVFDVSTSPSRSNPVALLQPQPRLEQLFPPHSDASPRAAHMMPPVTYVGLVGDSLYALGHDNFPLVVFDQTPPLSIPEGDSVNNPKCNGVECLVGSRKLDSASQWYPPLLIDPPTPSETELKEQLSVERPEIKVDVPGLETSINQSILTLPEPAAPGWEMDIRTWGVLGFTLLLGITIAKLFMNNSREISRQVNDLPKSNLVGEARGLPVGPSPAVPAVIPTEDPPATPATPAVDIPVQTSNTLPAPNPTEPGLDIEDNEDTDREADGGQVRRKGPRRRRRGKKKKSEQVTDNPDLGEAAESEEFVQVELPVQQPATPKLSPPSVATPSTPLLPLSPVPIPPPTPMPKVESPSSSSLVVSETVLGFGSHGTVVFEGSLQGRAVAVKRLLQDFVTVATREVELLQESDDHPNVIRYFYKESREGFMYIALELCPASLADIIEKPSSYAAVVKAFDPKRGLWQITSGLRHLHTLKIVHRDIKPQNILVSRPKNGQHRMLISDFGLCKKLDVDQTSFLPTVHGAMAAGTVGWRAPEILRGDVKLDEQTLDPDDLSSRGSTASGRSSNSTGVKPARLTKSVDIFALGCLFFYTLTQGGHPFGDRFEREANIMKDRMDLDGLQTFGEEGVEAMHLISSMLAQEPKNRPDTTSILTHPFFWTPGRRLNFLQDASDRFEIMCRDPRDPDLITLETNAYDVVGNDWAARLDKVFVENLGKFRKYDGRSVQDLLRALRNKKHHYQDLPDHVKRHLGPLPEGFLSYFTRRFPALFLHVYGVVQHSGLCKEPMFRSYFELSET